MLQLQTLIPSNMQRKCVEAGFTTADGGDTYTVNLTGRFAAGAAQTFAFKSADLLFFDSADINEKYSYTGR